MSPRQPEAARGRLRLIVTPSASRSEVVSIDGDGVRIRVAAPPSDGKANKAVLALLALKLHVPPSRLCLLRGFGSRHKVVQVEGLNSEEALRRLAPVDSIGYSSPG